MYRYGKPGGERFKITHEAVDSVGKVTKAFHNETVRIQNLLGRNNYKVPWIPTRHKSVFVNLDRIAANTPFELKRT